MSFYRYENSLFYPFDSNFIINILFYPQSAFYPWSAVCSLHFTLSLHFTPGLQSAVCSLQSAFYTDRVKTDYFEVNGLNVMTEF